MKLFLLLLSLICFTGSIAQDACDDASRISIANGGYATGVYYSDTVSLSAASVEPGEYFSPVIAGAGLTARSVWFKFSIPSSRKVFVSLEQPGNIILPGNVGFTIYRAGSCLPSAPSVYSRFSAIADFGSTGHACTEPGDYIIQVTANSVTTGDVYVKLDISDTTGALYDRSQDAQVLGLGQAPLVDDFIVDCHSVSDLTELCSPVDVPGSFTKSTWHTFRTPAYFDALNMMINSPDCIFPGAGRYIIGYQLYQGNSRNTPVSALVPVHGCDTMMTNGSFPGLRSYSCDELLPLTEYTLRLIYQESFSGPLKIYILRTGTTRTTAPLPVLSQMGSNNLGDLPSSPSGSFSTFRDWFGCRSRHSVSACPVVLPPAGIDAFGRNFGLSTFFNFHLPTAANLEMSATVPCGTPVLLRLFRQLPGNDCSELDMSNLVSEFLTSSSFECIAPGNYTVQLSGIDSLQGIRLRSGGCTPVDSCIRSSFGQPVTLSFYSESINFENLFSLSSSDRFNAINATGGIMQPLANGVAYTSDADTFGCNRTVLPPALAGSNCLPTADKVIYREFIVGDADANGTADSGIVKIMYDGLSNGEFLNFILYKGDASALSLSQGVNAFPDTIAGLIPMTECRMVSFCDFDKVCVTPGTYTLVTLTDGAYSEPGDNQPVIQFDIVKSKYGDPMKAENLGNIIDSLRALGSDTLRTSIDTFSCFDNAVPINGYDPPDWGTGHPASKALYREFYLSEPSAVEICRTLDGCNGAGYVSVFAGRASEGLDSLEVLDLAQGFYSNRCISTKACEPLAAGWYTVVSYGTGPTYSEPFKELNELASQYGSYTGVTNRLRIRVRPSCNGPRFNRPHKAAVDSATGDPFLIEYRNDTANTSPYPAAGTTYDLPLEYLNCTTDTLFSTHPILACNSFMNRVTYYVFRTTQEAYVEINTYGLWAQVYNLDVRKDSMLFPATTPIQSCLSREGYIQICRLIPGVYTLVLFAGDDDLENGCGGAIASIYIDSVGYSRFDHANDAYDFGVVPADFVFHNGRPGDINPVDSRWAPATDFFFCTTGARQTDPVGMACRVSVNPRVYDPRQNNSLFNLNNLALQNGNTVRRNLWFTFVADTPGRVTIEALNRTPGKDSAYGISVFKSNVDAGIPFSVLQNTGGVDSTLSMGLQLVKTNRHADFCDSVLTLEFNREPCTSANPERYYVVIDNPNYDGIMRPNSQVELQIRIWPTNSFTSFYDHYSTAADVGDITLGSYVAATGNVTCATADSTDPVLIPTSPPCAPKTLWYKFTSLINGKLLFRVQAGTIVNGNDAFQLLKEIIPGDSTSVGLFNLSPVTTGYNGANGSWSKVCIEPGTYYLVVTGCRPDDGEVTPEFLLVQDEGDHCNTAVILPLTGPGNFETSIIPDCHTIGTGFGEMNAILSCPPGGVTSNYKSSWFRIDITGTDTLDLGAWLEEDTNSPSSDIKYRLLNGNCSTMQEQVCVQDAGTVNLYQCMPPGSYFIQVFTPLVYNGSPVQGSIKLKVNAVKHSGICTPVPPCAVVADFDYEIGCSGGAPVRFINNSSSGAGIRYHWNFGHAGQTDSVASPQFSYPVLETAQTYLVTLIVNNSADGCGKDTLMLPVTIPPGLVVSLGNDTTLCASALPYVLSATKIPGALYEWNDGSTADTLVIASPSSQIYTLTVTHNGCRISDTISIDVLQVDSSVTSLSLCSSELPYQWNGLAINAAGTYRAVLSSMAACDSIAVLNVVVSLSPPGPGVTNVEFCQMDVPVPLQATPSQASFVISWHLQATGGTGSADPPVPVTTVPGTYLFYASESDGTCESVRVPLAVTVSSGPDLGSDRQLQVCEGESANLLTLFNTSGLTSNWTLGTNPVVQPGNVTEAGIYQLVVSNGSCSDTALVQVEIFPAVTADAGEDTTVQVNIPFSLTGAGGDFYLWSPSVFFTDPTLPDQVVVIGNDQAFILEVTNSYGCKAFDTVLVSVMKDPGLLLPSAFTPNGDGLNDVFRPLPGKVIRLYYLRIFNRFGEMVFQSFDGSRGWDGNYRGQKQNTGAYVWVLKGMDANGEIKTVSGTVLLIRAP